MYALRVRARDAFDQSASSLLRRIAVEHGLPVAASSTRAELVEGLAARFAEPRHLEVVLSALDAASRSALAAARQTGGEVRGLLLARHLGTDDPRAAQALVDRGLLVRTFAPTGPHRGEVFAVPDEVLALLPEPQAAGPSFSIEPAPAPERGDRRTSDPAFSLFALASFLQRHPASELAGDGRRPAAFHAETHQWAQEPGGWPWIARWVFFQRLALAAHYLEHDPEGSLRPAPRLRQALDQRGGLVTRLWEAYLGLREARDTDVVRAEIPHADVIAEQSDPEVLRGVIVNALRSIPPGEWWTIQDVDRSIRERTPELLK